MDRSGRTITLAWAGLFGMIAASQAALAAGALCGPKPAIVETPPSAAQIRLANDRCRFSPAIGADISGQMSAILSRPAHCGLPTGTFASLTMRPKRHIAAAAPLCSGSACGIVLSRMDETP